MAVGIAEEGHIPDGRTRISGAVEKPPFTPRQRAQPLHFFPTRAGHAQVSRRDERMVDLAPLGEDDDEGARVITQPRHLESRRGHRPTVHHLHPGVRRVERDAVIEVAHRQGHMGQPEIDHHTPPYGSLLPLLRTMVHEQGIAASRSSDLLTLRPPGPLACGWRAAHSGVLPAPPPRPRRLPAHNLRPPAPLLPCAHAPDSLLWMDSVRQWSDADPPRLPARAASA